MSKIYIAYDDEKAIIGFENSDGELEYTTYTAEDGGTMTIFSKQNFQYLVRDEDIEEDIMEILETE